MGIREWGIGTGVMDGPVFTWAAENNRLRMTVSYFGMSDTIIMEYTLSGKTLTVTYEGETDVYTKK